MSLVNMLPPRIMSKHSKFPRMYTQTYFIKHHKLSDSDIIGVDKFKGQLQELQGGVGLHFLVSLLLKNENLIDTDSSLVPATTSRSVPSNDHLRTPSGTGVQGGGG